MDRELKDAMSRFITKADQHDEKTREWIRGFWVRGGASLVAHELDSIAAGAIEARKNLDADVETTAYFMSIVISVGVDRMRKLLIETAFDEPDEKQGNE